jgi:hypothetical protein
MRYGKFTSSEIWKLMTNGRAAGSIGAQGQTYIESRKYERKLNRRISNSASGRAAEWGTAVEGYAFDQLGPEYRIQSNHSEFIVNPAMPYHGGTPDCIRFEGSTPVAVCDIKCPYTLLAFCQLSEVTDGELLKLDFPEYYWQLVSNAILTGLDVAELIVFCPVEAEIEKVKEHVASYYKWADWAATSELPYLVDGGEYSRFHKVIFDVPQADKEALIARLMMAEAKMAEWGVSYIAEMDAEVNAVIVEKP